MANVSYRCIYIPMVAAAVGAVIRVCLGSDIGYTGNLPSVATGIMLILISIVFRYGAELEQKVQSLEHGKE